MNTRFTFSELANIVNGKLTLQSENLVIQNLSIDSRTISTSKNTCFFALVGERKNGKVLYQTIFSPSRI